MARFPEVYADKRWEPARQECIRRTKNGLCQACLRKGIVRAGKIVDHIIELTKKNKDNPNIAFNPDNLEFKCNDCHEHKHGRSIGLQDFLTPPGV